jgi:hypothetical protein
LRCSSRTSTTDTAQAIAKEAQQRRGGPGGTGSGGAFVRGAAQQQRLQQAAAATKNKALQVRGARVTLQGRLASLLI